VVELPAIRACLEEGLVVIAAGGGGIPVFGDKDVSQGVQAVVDKDLTSALIAIAIPADLFVIVTGVDRVCLDYGTARARPLDALTANEARTHLASGQFPEGSMGPKIQAALAFLEGGGREAVITDAPHLVQAVEGRAGTRIRSSPPAALLPP
jgi:carbamate kinase